MLNKKTLFIHIGYGKTGTTTLQNYIFPKFDVEYLGKFNDFTKDYKYILEFRKHICNNKNIYKTPPLIFKKIKKKINESQKEQLLISDEAFTSDNSLIHIDNNNIFEKAKNIFFFGEYIKDICNIKILISIRQQEKIIISHYTEIGHNYYDIKDFIKKIIKKDYFNYKIIINYYFKLFGNNNLYIWTMEEIFFDTEKYINNIKKYINIKDKKKIINILNKKHSNKRKIGNKEYIISNNNNNLFINIIKKIYQQYFKKYFKNTKIIFKIIYYINKINNFKNTNKIIKIKINKKDSNKIKNYYKYNNLIINKRYNLNLKKYNYY